MHSGRPRPRDCAAFGWRLVNALLRALAILAFVTLSENPAKAGAQRHSNQPRQEKIGPFAPDLMLASRLFAEASPPLRLKRMDGSPPAWAVSDAEGTIGYVASTWEVAGSVGYSGRPLDVLVGVSVAGRITGAKLIRHNEPILTLGISTEDIEAYVSAFAGYDLTKPKVGAFDDSVRLPPIIARATVSTGVIRDSILRTARSVALGYLTIFETAASIDRESFQEKTWNALASDGSIIRVTLSLTEARQQFGRVRNPPPHGDKPFIDLWVGIVDPPTIGRNLLGDREFSRVIGSLTPGDTALFVFSNGLHSHRGTAYRQTGVFDRLEVIQGASTIRLKKSDYRRVDRLALADAPRFREMSIFRVSQESGFIPTEPFRIEVTAQRKTQTGTIASVRIPLQYALPNTYKLRAPSPEIAEIRPLWQSAWQDKEPIVAAGIVMIGIVGAALFFQGPIVRRPRLWFRGRMGFLSLTLVWLGWIVGGQLSVVQVVAFIHSLLTGFRWETFLIEPVIFLLWAFVALGMLFWGRGVYCGWLCPFGALQELLNEGAKRLRFPQLHVPFVVHERLWSIKYVLFMIILALSFYSMEQALILAEVEPFKTAISLRFIREWPFVLFVLSLLFIGLFIERFYCRYLCPLGAALAIPAKLKLFDWLARRPQCGRECRFCETECTVAAIDPLGRINPNECVLCLKCQVILSDEAQCIILKQRAARRSRNAHPKDTNRPAETETPSRRTT